MPTVLKTVSGWSNLAVGWMVVIPMTLSLVFMLWVGDHSSATGEKRWHGAGGMFLAAAGMLFGTMTSNPLMAFLFMCMAGIGVYAALGVFNRPSNERLQLAGYMGRRRMTRSDANAAAGHSISQSVTEF